MSELRVQLRLSAEDVRSVGTLVEDRGRVWFSWDPDFARGGVELSPYDLPLASEALVEHPVRPGVPIPGVFGDSRPDGWGLKLLHRGFADRGRPASSVTALEELAFLGANTMGALCYEPATGPSGGLDDAVELAALAAHAQDVYEGPVETVLPELIRAGGSPGGARPKALIGLRADGSPGVCHGEGELGPGWEAWLVKFAARDEDSDVVRREWAWMRLAEASGLSVPACRVLDLPGVGGGFAVRRFDRPGSGQRRHLLSAAGALGVDFRSAFADYADLLRLCAVICGGDAREQIALYRLAVFNALAINEDDHLKNFAWTADSQGWKLAPGFDLTYSPHERGRSTTVAGAERSVTRSDLLRLADGAGIAARRAEAVIDQVAAGCSSVEAVLEDCGCRNPVSQAASRAVQAAVTRVTEPG